MVSRLDSINFLASPASVLPTALGLAQEIVEKCSPDSVQSTKRALILAEDHVKSIVDAALTKESDGMFDGGNLKEGLRAFVEVCPFTFVVSSSDRFLPIPETSSCVEKPKVETIRSLKSVHIRFGKLGCCIHL